MFFYKLEISAFFRNMFLVFDALLFIYLNVFIMEYC